MITQHKRRLFTELKQSIKEIQAYKAGKITLRTYRITIKEKPLPKMDARLGKI